MRACPSLWVYLFFTLTVCVILIIRADGPVLTQIELYLLNPRVEVHPVLTNSMSSFRLVFNILSGMV